MKNRNLPHALWSTASFGETADTSPGELSALGDHLSLCKGSHGHLFAVQCAIEAVNGFASARFITTLVVAAVLIGLSLLAL